MGFGQTYISKSCECNPKDQSKWEIAEPRRGKKNALVRCNQCGNQWRTSAKYIDNLPLASYIKRAK